MPPKRVRKPAASKKVASASAGMIVQVKRLGKGDALHDATALHIDKYPRGEGKATYMLVLRFEDGKAGRKIVSKADAEGMYGALEIKNATPKPKSDKPKKKRVAKPKVAEEKIFASLTAAPVKKKRVAKPKVPYCDKYADAYQARCLERVGDEAACSEYATARKSRCTSMKASGKNPRISKDRTCDEIGQTAGNRAYNKAEGSERRRRRVGGAAKRASKARCEDARKAKKIGRFTVSRRM